jgi:predicted kinase
VLLAGASSCLAAGAFKKESRQLERRLYAASQTVSGEELAILAEADVRGRQCPDQQALLDEVALFRELCCAHECFVGPREFANAHSRFAYFRAPHRDASYEAYDDTRGEVVVLSGLPGVGKDHFIDVRRNTLGEVISLDAIRRQIGAPPSGEPGRVIDLARQRARELLRAGAAFCWNATNLTRDLRSRIIDLATDYGFSTRIVYLEVPWLQLLEQNAAREHAVPQAVLRKMLRRLEPPDLTEAYNIEARVSSSHHGDRQDSDSDNE